MADLMILEFDGVDEAGYQRVNEALGIDVSRDSGNWPAGLVSHTAGPGEDGWVVVELWESRAAQEAFMQSRLGPALHRTGIEQPPKRLTWIPVRASANPGRSTAKG